MTDKRYRSLMWDNEIETQLTKIEIEEGWHFCPDWDDLLIGPGMPEIDCCTCRKKNIRTT